MMRFPILRGCCAPRTKLRRERGAALLIALVMLLILTVVGVTSMRTSTMQERMAGNMRDREIAFQAAERALRDAEVFMDSQDDLPNPNMGTFFHTEGNAPAWDAMACGTANDNVQDVAMPNAQSACYAIEQITSAGTGNVNNPGQVVNETTLFRVVARGTGLAGRSEVILRSSYRW